MDEPKRHTPLAGLRRSAGLTQTQAAEACGVSQASYYQWEAGSSLPTVDKLPAIARAMKVSTALLVPALLETKKVYEGRTANAEAERNAGAGG